MFLASVALASSLGLVRFEKVAPGIEHAELRSDAGFSGHAFRLDLAKVELRIVPAGAPGVRNSVARLTAALPLVVATNASFFDVDGKAMGAIYSEGKPIQRKLRSGWGALVVSGRRASLRTSLDGVRSPELVVQGTPFLVREGNVVRLKPQRSERTAVCAEEGRLLLVSVSPVFATDFANFLAAPEGQGLGCRNALNLDGGSSRHLVVRLPGLSLDVSGASGVPNALAVVPKGP